MPDFEPAAQRNIAAKKAKKRASASMGLERFGSVGLALLVLVVWQLAVPLLGLSEFVLPTPWAIAQRMVTSAPLLAINGWYTLLEVVAGFVASVLIGVPLSLAIFYSRVFERAVYPLLVALQNGSIFRLRPFSSSISATDGDLRSDSHS